MQQNAFNATIDGVGQLTYGLTWNPGTGYSISGSGPITFGLLWLVGDIWVNGDVCAPVTWTSCTCSINCL